MSQYIQIKCYPQSSIQCRISPSMMIGQIITLDDDNWEDYWYSLVLETLVSQILKNWIWEKMYVSNLIRHHSTRSLFVMLCDFEGGALHYYNTTGAVIPK